VQVREVKGAAMSVERFCIVLDNPLACYLPGQDVSGKVEFWTTRTKTIKGIKFKTVNNVNHLNKMKN
jgi:hypothetical protein